VALLGYGNWCDECNEVRDEHCEIVERLRAALASTAIVLSAREREILSLRTRKTARRTALHCKIAVGEVAHLERRVLQDGAN
jgi:DNA-directed RNA polymerase specialized sigma subunit